MRSCRWHKLTVIGFTSLMNVRRNLGAVLGAEVHHNPHRGECLLTYIFLQSPFKPLQYIYTQNLSV